MARVVLMCGPAGSGKSTYARRLEAAGMVRLSMDQEAWRRGLRSMPLPADLHREIEDDLRRRLVQCVSDGVDVVVDLALWSRAARAEYRELVRPFGVRPETVYVATDRETALGRVRARRLADGDDYRLSDELAAAYFDHFEPPTPEEGPLTVVRG